MWEDDMYDSLSTVEIRSSMGPSAPLWEGVITYIEYRTAECMVNRSKADGPLVGRPSSTLLHLLVLPVGRRVRWRRKLKSQMSVPGR